MNYEKMLVMHEKANKDTAHYRKDILKVYCPYLFNGGRKEISLDNMGKTYRLFIEKGFMHSKVTPFVKYCEMLEKEGYIIT
jgi:hypothetical protein